MYKIEVSSKKVEKRIKQYISLRKDIINKLEKLKGDPHKSNGAHKLHGKLSGKWACWLGSNIRLIYVIDENKKVLSLDAVGTHKIY
ncbi:hypothetical protein COU61_01470 [Candidatus Pacearchaeota archaeon CG10_big_fil_rev_8_21_14_0_10_35_13]|nr:MAG: hypothetical protein COU61_01470 [Candidatus Pacearchaeota archaeon CG10_big_fil_rev_8_21_14_0_10_35_13]